MKIFNNITTVIFLLLFSTIINSQTTFSSIKSGNWDDPSIWSPASIPGNSDTVLISQQTIVSTNGSREVAGFKIIIGGELVLSGNDGSLTITSNGIWGGGIIRDATTIGNGIVTISNNAVFLLTDNNWSGELKDGTTLRNLGTISQEVNAGLFARDSSIVDNQSLYEINADNANYHGIPNGGIFINTGTFRNKGTGTTNFNSNWEFQNLGGTIDVQSGTLAFNCDGIFKGGSYNADEGALLLFDSEDQTFEGTLAGAPKGTVELSAGVTARIGSTDVVFDFQGTGFTWSGGTITGGIITIPNNSLLVLNGGSFPGFLSEGTTLLNLGTILQVENLGINTLDSSIVDNRALYEITADNANFGGNNNGGVFNNTGTFRNKGTGTCSFDSNWEFRNLVGGIIHAASGTIEIEIFENFQDATIEGIASVKVPNSFLNNGINSPGNSVGVLTYIGDYNPSTTGVLDIELSGLTPGSGHDQLSVLGNSNLNGTLNISLTNGFIPAVGDSFVVLTATNNVADSFKTVNVQNGLFIELHYNSNYVTIIVDSLGTIVSANDETETAILTDYVLNQNYPNPFNPTTTISYSIPNVASQFSLTNVQLTIYDLLGKEVATLVNEVQRAGIYNVDFDGSRLASGIYYYQLKTGKFVETKKMILLK